MTEDWRINEQNSVKIAAWEGGHKDDTVFIVLVDEDRLPHKFKFDRQQCIEFANWILDGLPAAPEG